MPRLDLKIPSTAPRDVEELTQRARALAGRNLGDLAHWAACPLPQDLSRSKGVIGQLIELCLGAQAGNRALPDFTELGIELKTIPIGDDDKALQSTYVSMVPLCDLEQQRWHRSTVYRKLGQVLWVPIQAAAKIPLAQRVVGQAFLWQANAEEEALLRADWEYHLARIRAGAVDAISGRDGAVLQVRPKGRDSRSMTWADRPKQGLMITQPRGFYLRPTFTNYLIKKYFFGLTPDPVETFARAQIQPRQVP